MRRNYPIGGISVDDIVCINLKKRKNRKAHMKRESRKKNFPLRFVEAIENTANPSRGKFESHLKCIVQAKRAFSKNILIFEDDCQILVKQLAIPNPPADWDMIYLGGNIQTVIQDNDTDNSHDWKRACCLMCHAYIVNRNAYKVILDAGFKLLRDTPAHIQINIDEWYCKEIHPKLKTYITTPERVIQIDGYSDVKCRDITYRQQLTGGSSLDTDIVAPDKLQIPAYEETTDSESGKTFQRIKMPEAVTDTDLPLVALITCIHNQADLFQLIQWSYYNIDYPREKMTWIIVDDSADEHKVVQLIDGKDISIKYVSCNMGNSDSFLSISKKVNIAMSYITPNTKYIVNYSPDCYYPKESLRARIRLMLAYPDYQCFGSVKYGVHDASTGKNWEQYSVDGKGNQTIPFCPSLSFTRDFWLERPFDESQYTLETYYFIKGRWNKVMDVPYGLIMIALTWNGNLFSETARYGMKGKATASSLTNVASTKNSTGNNLISDINSNSVRRVDDNTTTQFQDEWDLESRNMVMMLGRILTSKNEY